MNSKELETLKSASLERAFWRFQKAFDFLQKRGRGAMFCPNWLFDHFEGNWMIVDWDTWSKTSWFHSWSPNTLANEERPPFVYLRLSNYFGMFLGDLETPMFGWYYLTSKQFLDLAPKLFMIEKDFGYIDFQGGLNFKGEAQGHFHQGFLHGIYKKNRGPILEFQNGMTIWSEKYTNKLSPSLFPFLSEAHYQSFKDYHWQNFKTKTFEPIIIDLDSDQLKNYLAKTGFDRQILLMYWNTLPKGKCLIAQ